MSNTIVVTGAASGIGRALALAHIQRGDRVYGLDRSLDSATDMAAPGLDWRCIDVSDASALEAYAAEIWAEAGGVDWVYANAGVPAAGALLNVTPEQFDQCFAVNLVGAWATLQVFARRMVAAGRPGRLCVTASEHALGYQHPGAGIYTASKHAVLGLADVWRHELPKNISMSVLCPGLTATRIGESPDNSTAANKMGRAVMAEGLDPAIVARATLEGMERGDFIITTHAASVIGWEKRRGDVDAAFAHVPPEARDVERFAVPATIRRVRARLTDEA